MSDTPREDAIAALDVDRLMDAIVAAEKATGWDLNVGEGVLAEAIAREYAALGAEAETPDPERQHYTAYVDGRQCHNCGLEPYRHDCPTGRSRFGHWVDLASPEFAEALARALERTGHCGDDHQATLGPIDPSEHDDPGCLFRPESMKDAAAILAAMRETGR